MITCSTSYKNAALNASSDVTWSDLYPSLRSLAHRLVFSFHIPCWQGQEYDIAEDIVQETMRRLIEYAQKVELGDAIPIRSLECLMRVIACNYCKDLRRHDLRLVHMTSDDDAYDIYTMMEISVDPSEVATENIYQEGLFTLIACEIARFPEKQRVALLIDLASRMSFDTPPTPLQEAFLKVGMRLQEYRGPLPSDRVGRNRHASLLSQAYKRLTLLLDVQEDDIAA